MKMFVLYAEKKCIHTYVISNYPGAVCTLNQKRLIRTLCDELGKPHPNFDKLKRGEAHRLISNMLHEKKLARDSTS